MRDEISIFAVNTMSVVGTIDTEGNKRALFGLSYDDTHRLIAFPDGKIGHLKLRDIDKKKSKKINAHKHPVQCIGMDYKGKYVASSSTKGTIIRIFRTDDLTCIQELRRGMDNATILSLNFNLSATMLGSSSDSGTVHIFKIDEYESNFQDQNLSLISGTSSGSGDGKNGKKKDAKGGNRKRLTFLRKAIPYFKSEWSNSSIRVKEQIVIVDFAANGEDLLIYVKHGRVYT